MVVTDLAMVNCHRQGLRFGQGLSHQHQLTTMLILMFRPNPVLFFSHLLQLSWYPYGGG